MVNNGERTCNNRLGQHRRERKRSGSKDKMQNIDFGNDDHKQTNKKQSLKKYQSTG
jgi:hypothetical protein